jgi:hypothetical protein
VVGPLILIFLGGVFLLQNLGVLPPNFCQNLWRLWPVVLVLAGIELLFAHRIPWIALVGIAAVVLMLGALATNARRPETTPTTATVPRTSPVDLGGAVQAAITVRFGSGQLDVGPLAQPGATQLANMTYDGPTDFVPVTHYEPSSGAIGKLEYQFGESHGAAYIPFAGHGPGEPHMTLELNPNVPITAMTIQTGATDARLDLGTLQVNSLDMSIGAASTWVRLPQINGTSQVHVSGGAATLALEVPQGVAARIRHRGGLSTVTVDPTRFPAVGDGLYQSSDYDTATSKVDVTLETGVTTIQVR